MTEQNAPALVGDKAGALPWPFAVTARPVFVMPDVAERDQQDREMVAQIIREQRQTIQDLDRALREGRTVRPDAPYLGRHPRVWMDR